MSSSSSSSQKVMVNDVFSFRVSFPLTSTKKRKIIKIYIGFLPLTHSLLFLSPQSLTHTVYWFILAVKHFHKNALKVLLRITHVDKRKVWHDDTFEINFHDKAEKYEIPKNISIPHSLINFLLNHIRCLTLWINNSILTVIK